MSTWRAKAAVTKRDSFNQHQRIFSSWPGWLHTFQKLGFHAAFLVPVLLKPARARVYIITWIAIISQLSPLNKNKSDSNCTYLVTLHALVTTSNRLTPARSDRGDAGIFQKRKCPVIYNSLLAAVTMTDRV